MSMGALGTAYQSLLRSGRLLQNPSQEALISRLERLQNQLMHDGGSLTGLYIYGGVGTGKSRIADLFAATLPRRITRRRSHFHEFMLDIHSRLHRARSLPGYRGDPLMQIGQEVCAESQVLCFDEFQVTDIADAMILQRLFGSIWRSGGMMVSTSNRHPDDLYENGLNRPLFVPFIQELQRRCEVWQMRGDQDYRMTVTSEREMVFFTARDAFLASLQSITKDQELTWTTIPVMMGRKLAVRACSSPDGTKKIVHASFEELCEAKLGAADYQALCNTAGVIYLDGLRQLRRNEFDFARRFIVLIDIAYEFKTRIVCYSKAPAEIVFAEIVQSERVRQGASLERLGAMNVKKGGGSSSSMMSTFVGDIEWSATGLQASLARGGAGETDVSFAIGRAVSRLHEMGSKAYGSID